MEHQQIFPTNLFIYDDFYNEQIQDAVIIGKSYDNLYSESQEKYLKIIENNIKRINAGFILIT